MTNPIANIGQNIQFVAFWAHFGVAALVVEHSPWPWATCALIVVVAGLKEFWFDATYEKNPPQTFLDNFEDWIGWGVGALAGALLH